MWTKENRAKYNRDHLRYPSDLTDDEWACRAAASTGEAWRRQAPHRHACGHERRNVYPEHRFSAAQHGAQLFRLVAVRSRAGSHSSRALRRASNLALAIASIPARVT